MADLSTGDAKLVQYLNEAYGTEMRLETALQEHITMAERASYRKRLKDHLGETKRHAREVKAAITRLGGQAEAFSAPGPQSVGDVAQAVVGGAQKAVALAQGPLHMLRGTGPAEKQLKNAKTEYASEAEEIATYTAIATLAETLGKRDVRQLARAILREEERMSSFLQKEIARLTSAVARAEVPAAERNGGSSKRRTRRGTAKRASASRASTSAGKASARKSTTKRAASAGRSRAKAAASGTRKAAASGARKASASARKASSSGARKASSSARKASSSSARKVTPGGSRQGSGAGRKVTTSRKVSPGTRKAPGGTRKAPPATPTAPAPAPLTPLTPPVGVI